MRVRITFAKSGALRYIGHLDLHQVWERTIRRAGLPLAYTQGFHPGPKIQVASALPLGFTGTAEVIDIWLKAEEMEGMANHPAEMEAVRERLQLASPPGLALLQVEVVDERAPALQTQVHAAAYTVTLLDESSPRGLEAKISALLAAKSLPRQRRGKDYDLRPLVLSLEFQDMELSMVLSAREGATGRPEEVLSLLEIPLETARIERTRLILKNEIE